MGLFAKQKNHHQYTRARDLGVLVVRLTTGGLLAGHGAQKLFGSFGGYGLEGTSGWNQWGSSQASSGRSLPEHRNSAGAC